MNKIIEEAMIQGTKDIEATNKRLMETINKLIVEKDIIIAEKCLRISELTTGMIDLERQLKELKEMGEYEQIKSTYTL